MKVVLKTYNNLEDYNKNINPSEEEELSGISIALQRGRKKIRQVREERRKNEKAWRGCKIFTYRGEELYKLPLC